MTNLRELNNHEFCGISTLCLIQSINTPTPHQILAYLVQHQISVLLGVFLCRNRKNYLLQNVVVEFCNHRSHGVQSKRKS